MTVDANAAQPSSSRLGGRRRGTLLAALLLGGVAAVGAYLWYGRREAAPTLLPPDLSRLEAEPQVAKVLEAMRAKVLRQPRSAAAWGLLGKVLLAHGYREEALVCFAQAERLDPGNPRWPYYQGKVLVVYDPPIGLRHLRRAVEVCARVAPANTAPRLLLAESLAAQGQNDEAAVEFRRVLEKEPDNPRAHYRLGLLACARRDWQTGRSHLQQCLSSPLARRKAAIQLAVLCQRRGDDKSADEFRRKAARLPKDQQWTDPFAAEYLQLAVGKQGRIREIEQCEIEGRLTDAVELLRKMAVDYPDEPRVYSRLGRDLGHLERYAEAEQALRQAVQLGPDTVPQAYYYLSVTLFVQAEKRWKDGDRKAAATLFHEAADCARQALKPMPAHGYAHLYLGLSLKHLGRRPQALASLRAAVRYCPDLPEMHLALGEMLAEDERTAEAHEHLHKVLELTAVGDPRRKTARERLNILDNEDKNSDKNSTTRKRNAPG